MKEISNAAEVQDYLMGHAKVLDFSKYFTLHKTPSTCSAVRRPLEELYCNGSIVDLSDQDRKITLPSSIAIFSAKDSLDHFDFTYVRTLSTCTWWGSQSRDDMLETEVFRNIKAFIQRSPNLNLLKLGEVEN